ncbi:GNAT family N-acetyltransferase [Pseudoalteromonas sp. OOF1S-7]|uniref:GNAT family N-acetyltransferase n=1 Tax=Pseudoalteromonas sp. OOF1S-7 TaxID=2917757 RepID=UPI001EF6435F|nr:GNAT family N-acetyltransferase [Pseudoalteromonas sp. OOF1S-7]MCG7536666.1 GNAT family N-acetyltransferase [Pseudoalteromonas sp. OOF1S-7]
MLDKSHGAAKFTCRVALSEDIVRMSEIRLQVTENRLSDPGKVTPQMYQAHIAGQGKSWVCELNGLIVGFASAARQDGSIWALFILPEYEGLGMGKALLDLACEWLFSEGHKVLSLYTEINTRADGFYGAQGWSRGQEDEHGDVSYTLCKRTFYEHNGV